MVRAFCYVEILVMAMSKTLKSARSNYKGGERSMTGLNDDLISLISTAARSLADNSVGESEAFGELTEFNRFMVRENRTDFQIHAIRAWFENVCKFRLKEDGSVRPKRGLAMDSDWLQSIKDKPWYKYAKEQMFRVPEVNSMSEARNIAKREYLGETWTEADFIEYARQMMRDVEKAKSEKGYKDWVEKCDVELRRGTVKRFDAVESSAA